NVAAGVFDDPDDVAYLTGFFHFPNERPVAAWVPAGDGEDVVLLVPELEREYADHQRAAARIVSYPRFPGLPPAFTVLAKEVPAPTGPIGYGGSTMALRLEAIGEAFPDAQLARTRAVDDARIVKRPEEVALHREAGRITDAMLNAGRELVEEAL